MNRVGQAELLLQVGQQIQHLRLDRYVERRHRFVGDDQRRVEHQRTCNRDALALATGEHVRITLVVFGPQPDPLQHRPRSLLAFGRHSRSLLISSGACRIAPIFLRGFSEPYGF